MDIHMPKWDGRKAARQIREFEDQLNQNRDTATEQPVHIPIIAMTADAMKEDKDLCLQAGMDDYVAKPIKREIVFQMIKKWVNIHS
jgi:CheY-like chemotaxis protein